MCWLGLHMHLKENTLTLLSLLRRVKPQRDLKLAEPDLTVFICMISYLRWYSRRPGHRGDLPLSVQVASLVLVGLLTS